jgi:hypothetical protein
MERRSLTALDKRREHLLLMTFRHLDKILSDVDRCAEGKGSSSPLSDRYTELDPETKEAIQGYTTRLRETMCRILEEKGIPIDVPSFETIHRINTFLIFMDISAEEIRPKYMRGYGELTREAADELDAVATELQGLLKQMQAVLKRS